MRDEICHQYGTSLKMLNVYFKTYKYNQVVFPEVRNPEQTRELINVFPVLCSELKTACIQFARFLAFLKRLVV